MKYVLESLAVASLLLVSACASITQPETTEASTPISDAPGHGKSRFIKTYDANGDGAVSSAEFFAEREAGYNRRDFNGDESVHEEEYVSEYEERLLKRLEEERTGQIDQAHFRFNVLDTDDDANLSLEEFHASGQRMFSTLDTNGDGVVDDQDTASSF